MGARGPLQPALVARSDGQALENGFLDKYVRGSQVWPCWGLVDGPTAQIKQKRGVICGPDSANEASVSTYPPHFNAHHVPEHHTRTALNNSRKAEVKAAGLIAGENWAARCEPVLERQPPNHETHPRDCPIAHIRERAEGDHQLARVRGGLMPMSYPVNPERECKTVGMQRVEDPTFRTRGQLLETRKELMKRDNEELRLNGDEYYVPLSIRNGEREVEEFNFRRPKEEPMTLTRLKDNRLKDKIEYEMNHFSFPRSFPREYPKYSDHPDIPFWVSNAEDARIGSSPPQTLSRNHSEPAFKVTELPFGEEQRETYEAMPDSAKALAAGKMTLGRQTELGSKTVKRWSTDMLERGQVLLGSPPAYEVGQSEKRRLGDALQQDTECSSGKKCAFQFLQFAAAVDVQEGNSDAESDATDHQMVILKNLHTFESRGTTSVTRWKWGPASAWEGGVSALRVGGGEMENAFPWINKHAPRRPAAGVDSGAVHHREVL
ncbi:unnamed protein product [Symbiodinium sp. CCMP2456]|nr:unnamed protein product [Symbiodinium sp. CCMP2456]